MGKGVPSGQHQTKLARSSPGDIPYCPLHERRQRHVRFASLFEHLVGAAEQREWDGEAERPGCFEIDDKLKLCWKLDRKIGRLGTLENLSRIDSSAPE